MKAIGIGIGINFGGGVPPAPPSVVLGSDLKLDLDADLGITVTGAGVSAWVDQSGNANNFSQGTDASRPPYLTNQVNGHNAIDFQNANEFLVGPALSTIAAVSAVCIWVVCRTDAVSTNSGTITNNDCVFGDTSGRCGIHFKSAPTVHFCHFDGSFDEASVSHTVAGAYTILRARHAGGQIFMRNGDAAESAGVSSGNIDALTNLLRIGQLASSSTAYDGKVTRILATNIAPTVAQLDAVQVYLKARYAI